MPSMLPFTLAPLLDCLSNFLSFLAVFDRNPYTKVQAITILRAIDNVQIALKERGLDPLPVADYELYRPYKILKGFDMFHMSKG